jgi:hypothetical protein
MNKLFGFFAAVLMITFTSCATDELGTTENFTNDATEKICSETRTGDKGCFEFVYPITIKFADGSTKSVASHDSLKSAIKAWKTVNPDVKERPTVEFPYAVTTSEGTIVTVTTEAEKTALLATCKPKGKDHPGKGNGNGTPCYTVKFPFSIIKDSATVVINSAADLAAIAKNAHRDRHHLNFVFPITITLKDGTTKTINSIEELRALKETCRK